MTDLEWYLEIGGKQSGPHAAKEIVDLVRAGRIPATAQVTAARMSGDWVTAKDLVEAYDELYKKTAVPKHSLSEETQLLHKAAPVNSDPNYQPPPRPTEQLEATKNIFLNRTDLDSTPDPTEALFQAIQAVREKSKEKAVSSVSSGGTLGTSQRDQLGSTRREISPRVRAPIILILTLAAIFGGTIYGITRLLAGKKTEIEAKKSPSENIRKNSLPEEVEALPKSINMLLDSGGMGTVAPRSPRNIPRSTTVAPAARRMPTRRLEKGGGARYREDNEPPIDQRSDERRDEREMTENSGREGESNAEGRGTGLFPVDPAQVPLDNMNPEDGMAPQDGERQY